jgi:hypothetical protein
MPTPGWPVGKPPGGSPLNASCRSGGLLLSTLLMAKLEAAGPHLSRRASGSRGSARLSSAPSSQKNVRPAYSFHGPLRPSRAFCLLFGARGDHGPSFSPTAGLFLSLTNQRIRLIPPGSLSSCGMVVIAPRRALNRMFKALIRDELARVSGFVPWAGPIAKPVCQPRIFRNGLPSHPILLDVIDR